MAYDRYDTRDPRDERSRWRGERDEGRGWDRDREGRWGRDRDERGFFERAGDEVASWFGDEEAERRRREDRMRDERERGWSSRGREYSAFGRDRDRDWRRDEERRGTFGQRQERGWEGRERSRRDEPDWDRGERLLSSRWRGETSGGRERDRERDSDRERGYRPMTGDYGRGDYESEQFFAASGYGRGERGLSDYGRPESEYGRDEYRRTSFAGSSLGSDRDYDPHYRSWRDRHMSELDRDYDDYRREHQSRFEDDFGSWRQRRQQKRGLLGQIREHMEVVGNDDQHVGTVDRVAGDRLILSKSDTESGGAHHSLSCSEIDRVEGDRVILDCSAEQARQRWRDESRSRALFEREDQGEMGPRMLDRSFEGTYR
ncbi:MAG TPA: DUF2171 domain-containing protein [Sphingomicrobium sp.]